MPERGEVWQVDFGVTAKVRPVLVISVPYADADRALIAVIPHTTATRGSQFEVVVGARFLGEGAFLVQGLQAFPPKYFLRRWVSSLRPSFRALNSLCCSGSVSQAGERLVNETPGHTQGRVETHPPV